MLYKFVVFCFLCLASACSNKTEMNVPSYDFINPAYLNFEFSNSSDSIYLTSWHWNYIVQKEIATDSLLVMGNENMILEVKVNKPQCVQFNFNNKRIDFFFVPGDTTNVRIDFSKNLDSIIPEYTGKLALINLYYLKKHKRFNTWEFLRARAGFTQSSLDALGLEKNNDDLTKLELGFSNEFISLNPNIPQWYQEYENQSILFTNADFKISSIFYRNYMLGIKDSIHEGYYSFIEDMNINSDISILVNNYFGYLNGLLSHQIRLDINKGIDTLKRPGKNEYNPLFEFIEELDPKPRELFSVFKLFFYSRHIPKRLDSIKSLRNNITTPEYKGLLDSLDNNKFHLQKNAKAPGFYLQDSYGKYRTLKEYQGQVVLINFWSTSCIPCLKEMPSEDSLAEKLKEADFKLVSICLSSNEHIWRTKIKGRSSEIVYLFAQKNWNKLLKDSYKIAGYPTFVLIDKHGNISSANPSRPSNPELIEEIKALLEKN